MAANFVFIYSGHNSCATDRILSPYIMFLSIRGQFLLIFFPVFHCQKIPKIANLWLWTSKIIQSRLKSSKVVKNRPKSSIVVQCHQKSSISVEKQWMGACCSWSETGVVFIHTSIYIFINFIYFVFLFLKNN